MTLLIPLTLSAWASPGAVPVQGALSDAAGPLEGAHIVAFSLSSATRASALGSAEAWTQTQTVQFSAGAFVAVLGSDNSLDLDLFSTWSDLALAVSVDGGAWSAPVPLGRAPYAAHAARATLADNATRLGGRLPEDFAYTPGAGLTLTGRQFAVNSAVIAPAWNSITDRPAGLDDGDDVGAYTAGAGLRLTGATFSLAPVGDAGGVIAQLNAANYTPASVQTLLSGLDGLTRTCSGGTQTFNGTTGQWSACSGWNCTANPTHDGCVSSSAYGSCKAIKDDPSFNGGTGTYWIDWDGAATTYSPVRVYCEMTTAGGGWTRVFFQQIRDPSGNAAPYLNYAPNSAADVSTDAMATGGEGLWMTTKYQRFGYTELWVGGNYANTFRFTVPAAMRTMFDAGANLSSSIPISATLVNDQPPVSGTNSPTNVASQMNTFSRANGGCSSFGAAGVFDTVAFHDAPNNYNWYAETCRSTNNPVLGDTVGSHTWASGNADAVFWWYIR